MPNQAQDNPNDPTAYQDYLDFELEIGPDEGRGYSLSVLKSPAGEASTTVLFPYDVLALERYLDKLKIALLSRRGGSRLALSDEEKLVQQFGQSLFEFLLSGELRSRYDISRERADQQGLGLRLKLRILPPELAALPWEFLYDPREAEYLCLTTGAPLVRYLELPQPVQPLAVQPPLRILGMIAAPTDKEKLDVESEKERLDRAIQGLQARGQMQLTWLLGSTWRDLQRFLRLGPWHIFHFIGHGGYDHNADEGLIFLENDDRTAHRLGATQLARLLADHHPLRLVLLNACEGAHGGQQDIFSSTASILVRRGLPAVLAMQYPITDRAAIELTRSFYEALADGWPVDACVAEARKAISIDIPGSLEWGTPVLHLRAPDGLLFRLPHPSQSPTADSHGPTTAIDQTVGAVQGGTVIGSLIAGPGSTINIARSSSAQPPAAESQEPAAQSQSPAAWDQKLPAAELTFELAPGVRLTLVRVPAGEFWMGSDGDHDTNAFASELQARKCYLEEYWIGKYPITVKQFRTFVHAENYRTQAEQVGGSCYWFKGTKTDYPNASWRHPYGVQSNILNKDNHPVTNIARVDALTFCEWAESKSWAKGYKMRLPSEAEWEKAARGGLQIPRLQKGYIATFFDNPYPQRIYPWGDKPPPGEKHCNFNMNVKDTTPVGQYSRYGKSPYCCADMAGNVWEWTGSLYKAYPYKKDNEYETADPNQQRVLRGGAFFNEHMYVRCACREYSNPFLPFIYSGFRVVCSPVTSER